MPKTNSVMASLFTPSKWTPVLGLTVAISLTHIYCFLFTSVPPWVHMVAFLFWRLCYDVGIGWILRTQSQSFLFQRIVARVFERWPSFRPWFESWLSKSLDQKVTLEVFIFFIFFLL